MLKSIAQRVARFILRDELSNLQSSDMAYWHKAHELEQYVEVLKQESADYWYQAKELAHQVELLKEENAILQEEKLIAYQERKLAELEEKNSIATLDNKMLRSTLEILNEYLENLKAENAALREEATVYGLELIERTGQLEDVKEENAALKEKISHLDAEFDYNEFRRVHDGVYASDLDFTDTQHEMQEAARREHNAEMSDFAYEQLISKGIDPYGLDEFGI